jgi:RHS repeat-associated protein
MASSRNFSLAFGQSTTYASSSVNAYTSISGGGFQAPSPTYDPNGNTLTLPRPDGSSQALTWDAFDRLRSASNTQSQISKVYDPLGRLVWIRSIQSGQTAKDEIWSWTGWTLLTREVRQGSTTLDTFRYIWGPDLSTTLEGAGGVGGLLAIEHAPGNSTTWDIRYVHYDANGNVIALTDSSGSTSARYRYSPFGELIASEDLDNSGWNDRNIHRFSTKPEVTGTGLLYYGYRYYDPQTGRWPSRDPIEEEGGLNLYGLVGNDGVNGVDYLGFCENDSNGWKITDLHLEVKSLDEMYPQQPDINKASRWFFKTIRKGARDFDDTTLRKAYGVEVSLTYMCCVCKDGMYFWGGGGTLTDKDDTPRTRENAHEEGVQLRRNLVGQISCK